MVNEKMLEIIGMAIKKVSVTDEIKSVEYIIEDKTRQVNIDVDGTLRHTGDPLSQFEIELEDFVVQLFRLYCVQSVEFFEGYKVVTYGDDLDPNYFIFILKDNKIVQHGSNGFSDGYLHSGEQLVKHFLLQQET